MGFAVAALLLLSLGSACARAQQLSATQTAKMSPSNSDLSQPASADSSPQDVQGGHAERGSDGTFVMHENVSEVRLNVTVLDSSGRSIQTLDKEAFHIFEDGAAQTITSFRHEDLPVSLGILIDSSGSMYDKQAAVNAAALDLMKLSNPQDEAFLVDFSWQTMVDQDFTSDISKLQQGLSYITPKGETAVYDALVASADYISKNAKHPKQVLLIITDGEDNASSATLDQAIRSIQDFNGPVIYCIGLLFGDSASEAHHARKVLEALAEQTGGAAYFPKSVKEVDGIAREVANDIRTQYTITYSSTKASELGGYRAIRVEAKAKGFHKLSVRTRSGYYSRAAKALAHKPVAVPAQ
jgi:VWFA-related protein